ncbi:tetratricopeptide repeat protein [Desulfogranum japonicum]|uniref:tetratricopeptide repeat protein n=1 Tax=Desulfogranum japonicum TaxID=231447 RepID=UPI00048AF1AC|nr:hypothetical protein [Desulfogranum japonicum]
MQSIKKDHVVLVMLFAVSTAVSYLIYFKYQENIIEEEYKNALAVNTVENYNDYLINNNNTKYMVDIIYYRDKKAFENAKEIDTFESYQAFIDNYPQSSWISNVVYHRDRTALERAKKDRTLKSIVNFLNTYPKSGWLPQANYYLRHQFGFNDLSEAEYYLPNYN